MDCKILQGKAQMRRSAGQARQREVRVGASQIRREGEPKAGKTSWPDCLWSNRLARSRSISRSLAVRLHCQLTSICTALFNHVLQRLLSCLYCCATYLLHAAALTPHKGIVRRQPCSHQYALLARLGLVLGISRDRLPCLYQDLPRPQQ